MLERTRMFFRDHTLLREVLLWSLPAILAGAVLRYLLLSYLPYGYWGSDSKSYFSFAHQMIGTGDLSLDEKRRYIYPILMLPVALLPGAPLKWVAWLQHIMGIMAILPIAYIVRKCFRHWKWWVVPVTVAYALHPMFLWYEHELLGEALFFSALAWAFGGWVAFATQKKPEDARKVFWWFFIPLAIFLLTKPSGRFVLPGFFLGLIVIRAWRVLDWRRWVALLALVGATLTVGSKKQGAWLLYVSSFPLTQLDTKPYAEYKADIRDRVKPLADKPDLHYLNSRVPFDFLDSPSEEGGTPLWAALDKDAKKKKEVFMALALEGIKANPKGYLWQAWQRMVASANIAGFDDDRYESEYYSERMEKLYHGAEKELAAGKRSSIPLAFGLPKNGPLPPYDNFRLRLAQHSTWEEEMVKSVAHGYESVSDVVKLPPRKGTDEERAFGHTRLTPLGWWLLASLALALVRFRTLGILVIVAMVYLLGVFSVALVHTRFFLPAWLVFLPVLCVPLDLLLGGWRKSDR